MPYRCQKIGWHIAILIPVVFLCFILFAKFFNEGLIESESYLKWMVAVPIMMFFISIFLICMSREKEEDEMIAQIRMRIVTMMVYIYFVLFFAVGIFWSFDVALGFVGEYQGEVLGNFIIRMSVFLVLYEMIFKIRLWLNRKEFKNNSDE